MEDGSPNGADTDLIYLWDVAAGGYVDYSFHTDPSRGWYTEGGRRGRLVKRNHAVIYPDESFLIAKKSDGNVTFEFEGEINTDDKQLLLPASGYKNIILAKNPFGADMMLAELIPSTMITHYDGNDSLFRAGNDSEDGDLVTFLIGSYWKQFWYKDGNNSAVTSMHVIGTRRPLESGSNATTMDEDDFYIGSGSVTKIESCDATGDITNSDQSYSKLTILDSSDDLKGFTITFSDLQGYLLYENGPEEANASTGNQVTSPNRGSIVDSKLNGSFEIVKSGNGFVVIEKQRDINFDNNIGAPSWKIGQVGSGYDNNKNAVFYCIGGGAETDAKGEFQIQE